MEIQHKCIGLLLNILCSFRAFNIGRKASLQLLKMCLYTWLIEQALHIIAVPLPANLEFGYDIAKATKNMENRGLEN